MIFSNFKNFFKGLKKIEYCILKLKKILPYSSELGGIKKTFILVFVSFYINQTLYLIISYKFYKFFSFLHLIRKFHEFLDSQIRPNPEKYHNLRFTFNNFYY